MSSYLLIEIPGIWFNLNFYQLKFVKQTDSQIFNCKFPRGYHFGTYPNCNKILDKFCERRHPCEIALHFVQFQQHFHHPLSLSRKFSVEILSIHEESVSFHKKKQNGRWVKGIFFSIRDFFELKIFIKYSRSKKILNLQN